jgi:flagellar motor switch protein FliN/FliY
MANDDPLMSQDEIERLFSQTKDPAGARGHHVPMVGGKDDQPLAQDDIEKLLSESGRSAPAAPAGAATAAPPPPKSAAAPQRGTQYSASQEPDIAAQDIEYLLAQAEKALESVNSARPGAPGAPEEVPGHPLAGRVSSYRLDEFTPAAPSTETATLDLIRDVELDLKIELGRTHMYLEDVLKLRKGSVVPLDKLAGDPVDIYVNGRLIARGEVLVLNDNFCVRVAELIVGANVIS